ncbi:MAG: hypothetical protein PHS17_15185 [Desulfobacterales bacterium]|nr:hypothetical protein [Desulfobacterales bacterium]
MEMTVYNPQKGRLETIHAEITRENTTWFDNCRKESDVYTITDFEGCLLIKEFGYSYPTLVYDVTRASIGYKQKRAKGVLKEVKEEYK